MKDSFLSIITHSHIPKSIYWWIMVQHLSITVTSWHHSAHNIFNIWMPLNYSHMPSVNISIYCGFGQQYLSLWCIWDVCKLFTSLKGTRNPFILPLYLGGSYALLCSTKCGRRDSLQFRRLFLKRTISALIIRNVLFWKATTSA